MLTKKKEILFTSQSYDKSILQHFQDCLQAEEYERGTYTKRAVNLLKERTNCEHILLTHSCTAALEMSALLHQIKPGDEIIMPSFTFVSTANAFILRGAKPVFIDINPHTLNIDENLVEKAITSKTRAIVPVHYAGMSCNLDVLVALAERYNLTLIEDAAQSIGAKYKGKHLGTFGSLGTLSFHYTKNISAGFGGALLINNPKLLERAKIIHQRGTNRDAFLNGQIDKYTWVDLGSSYTMQEFSAVLLCNQLEKLEQINEHRKALSRRYLLKLKELESKNHIRLPIIPSYSSINGHIFYFILEKRMDRQNLFSFMKGRNIQLTSHYQPLHKSSFFQKQFGVIKLDQTEKIAQNLVRLPLHESLSFQDQDYVVEELTNFFK